MAELTAEQKRIKELEDQIAARDQADAEAARLQAEAAPAPTEDMDETIPGGAYRVGDQLVNANGEPIDSKGNVKK